MKIYSCFFKPLFDCIFSFILLIVISPILIVTALILSIIIKGNPFFLQSRPGKRGKIFRIIKFKTMTDERDSNGSLLPDEKRLTKTGAFIRSTSIDELPQLINVFKGDMSFIGPRPLLVQYLPLYSAEQARRHNVRPGITGWAQVNGRNTISWQQKFALDVWYVDNISFLTDLKIIFYTFRKVIVREGISADDNVTIEPFKGN